MTQVFGKKKRYCSWCLHKTNHAIVKEGINGIKRDFHLCNNCHNYTVKCRFCNNMARATPKELPKNGFKKWWRKNWNNVLCGEHDGTVPDFEKLNSKFDDIENYEYLFEKKKYNLKKVFTIISGVVVIAPLAFVGAGSLASALGAKGWLGVAGTGTAIQSLSGVALESASLAVIGGGSMANGAIIITATGAALGAGHGAVVSNAYFNSLNEFNITKENVGATNKNIIYIDGFLTENEESTIKWRRNLEKNNNFVEDYNWYYLSWESKTLEKLGGKILTDISGKQALKFAKKAAKRASRRAGKKLSPLTWATFLADFITNTWFVANCKATQTGIILADLIARTKNQSFTLMGHSLGARVIYYALENLSTKEEKYIDDVYLLGGAMEHHDDEGWEKATKAVNGCIYNAYSKNDKILKYLFKGAKLGKTAVGYSPIQYESNNIVNVDASHLVHDHKKWKNKFHEIFNS